MREAFVISSRLRSAYKINSVIYSLKSIPLVKRLLPAALYSNQGLKTFATIIGGIWEFLSAFLGKALYLLLLYLVTASQKTPAADSLTHMLIFLTIIGGFLNTQIFNPTKDKYYAMFIMRMDAAQYTLVNYFYFLLKILIGFLAFFCLFGRLCGASWLTCLAAPLYVISVKLCFTALSLGDCKKKRKTINENNPAALVWIGTGLLLLAAMAPPYLGFAIGELPFLLLTAVMILPAAFALWYILRFDEYKPIYKELLQPEGFASSSAGSTMGAAQQLALQKKISADISQTSNKSGYPYFNELFLKRHTKLLTRSAKRITVAATVFFIASAVACLLFPEAQAEVNGVLLTYLPYCLFVMYLLNRGKVITQAMFLNCDHSMLAYRFYRQPKALLSLFVERLKYIVLINLMPAAVIALGLPLLLYITGGTEQPLNYLFLFLSIIAMSVFFSVHNIVLYYLLQPYNVNLESKNAAYGVVNWATYLICYAAIRVQMPTLIFGSFISAFCLLYAVVAVILAYHLAPKTFKLRQ